MPVDLQQPPILFGVDNDQEETRRWLAYIAVAGLFITILVVIVGGWIILGKKVDDVLEVITTVASVIGGIVGAIIGFYFRHEG